MKQTLYIFLASVIVGCSQNASQTKQSNQDESGITPQIDLSQNEEVIISNSEIEINVARILKFHTGNKIEPLKTGDEYGELVSTDSTSIFSKVDSKNRFKILDEVIRDVPLSQYSVVCYYIDYNKPYIAILKNSNELEFIDKRGTQAINYDMYSKDIIGELKVWKKNYDFKVVGVASDFVDLRFKTMPEQSKEFENMVGDFCPDALDWLNDEEFILLIDKDRRLLNLWWD